MHANIANIGNFAVWKPFNQTALLLRYHTSASHRQNTFTQ